MGFESPLSDSAVNNEEAIALLKQTMPLELGTSVTYSSVVEVTAPRQMRRDFLAYLEAARADPHRTFLHCNTWYALGYRERFDETGALDRVRAFGEELVRKRRVTVDSFLFDDGRDSPHTLCRFDPGFRDGWTKVREAADHHGFGIGVLRSPWGGYQEAKVRVAAGKVAGNQTVKGGLALSGPKYYRQFVSTCLDMISKLW